MKEKLLNNFSLKLLAIVISIFLWGVIVNLNDPAGTRTINGVTVNMINEDSLTNKGYTYDILEGTKITVYVKGPKSEIESITASDIYAVADFSTISPVSDYVNIEARCTKTGKNGNELDVILKNSQVKINIENRETKNFDVAIELMGNPAPGYAVGNCDVSPMSVKITGAESIIESIARVVAEYDIEGASLDISESVRLHLYDSEDNLIDDSNLVFSRQEARVKIPILIKKTIPVSYAYVGTVDEDYAITDIIYSVQQVEIAGTSSNIAAISEITIPADRIDVTGLVANRDYNIKIGQFVPTNVKLLSSDTATVSIVVEPYIEKEFTFLTSSIAVEDMAEDMECELVEDVIKVTYKGIRADLEKIVDNKITASISLLDLWPGEKQILPVSFETVENCVPVGRYTVTVNISQMELEE